MIRNDQKSEIRSGDDHHEQVITATALQFIVDELCKMV